MVARWRGLIVYINIFSLLIYTIMATAVINAKQGLTRVPTYAELIKELDKEKIKTNEIRKVFDRNAWYFHDSPLNTAPNENNNIHPADLQQQNFKRMVQEATIAEDTAFHPMEEDEMEELRDDAVDLFEKSLEKEAEMREENERNIADQVSLSHTADYNAVNQTIMDSVGSTNSASAGIEEEEGKKSVIQAVMDKVKPVGKHMLKEAAKAIATSQGGVVGGLIADRLLDTSGETGNEKKSLAKSLGSTVAKNVAGAILPDVEHKPKPKAKGTKKTPLKTQRPDPTGLATTFTPKTKRRITKKSPPEEEEVEHMDTRIGSQKREEAGASTQTSKKFRKNSTPKRMEILNVDGEQPSRARPKAKASASASSSSSAPPQPSQEEEQQQQQEPKGVKKSIHKEHGAKVVIPSKVGIQVMREAFETGHNRQLIDLMTHRAYQDLFNQWKKASKEEKPERLKEMRQMYKEKVYPQLKQHQK